jgi:hypothetical protein
MLDYDKVEDGDGGDTAVDSGSSGRRPRPIRWLGKHMADCCECTGRLATCPCRTLLPLVVIGLVVLIALVVVVAVVAQRVWGMTPTETLAMIRDTVAGAATPSPPSGSGGGKEKLRVVPFNAALIAAAPPGACRGWLTLPPGGPMVTQFTWPAAWRGLLVLTTTAAANTTMHVFGPIETSVARDGSAVSWTCPACTALAAAHAAGDYLILTLDTQPFATVLFG